MEKLPNEVRKIIVSESDCDLNELAKKADRVMAQDKITKRNDLVRRKYVQTETNLSEQIEHLTQKVNNLMNRERPQTGFAHNYFQKQQYSVEDPYQRNNAIPLNQRWSFRYQDRSTNHNTFDLTRQKNFGANRAFRPAYRGFHPRNDYSTPRFPKPNQRNFSEQNGAENYRPFRRPEYLNSSRTNDAFFGQDNINNSARSYRLRPIPREEPQADQTSEKNVVNGIQKLSQNTFLMFARDPETGIEFLIDTGSCYSFLPYRGRTAPHLITDYLNAVNGTEIPIYGSETLQISLNSGQLFTWQFKRAEVGYPIIGFDFLKRFNILIDPCNNTLTVPGSYSGQPSMVKRTNFEHVSTKRNNDSPQMNAKRNETPTTVEQILKEYLDVFELDMFKEAPKHEATRGGQTFFSEGHIVPSVTSEGPASTNYAVFII